MLVNKQHFAELSSAIWLAAMGKSTILDGHRPNPEQAAHKLLWNACITIL